MGKGSQSSTINSQFQKARFRMHGTLLDRMLRFLRVSINHGRVQLANRDKGGLFVVRGNRFAGGIQDLSVALPSAGERE